MEKNVSIDFIVEIQLYIDGIYTNYVQIIILFLFFYIIFRENVNVFTIFILFLEKYECSL